MCGSKKCTSSFSTFGLKNKNKKQKASKCNKTLELLCQTPFYHYHPDLCLLSLKLTLLNSIFMSNSNICCMSDLHSKHHYSKSKLTRTLKEKTVT